MMFGILAFALVTSIAYFAAPSMPLYSARDIKIVSLDVSFSQMSISAKILAGVEIDNDNVVGGDIYSTLVDIYYPDWNGDLQKVGYLQESKEDSDMDCIRNGEGEDDHGMCIDTNTNPPSSPFLCVKSRGVSTSKKEAVTIFLQNVRPQTYLNVLKHFITQWGSIELLVSGVAHVKSPLGVPLSLGVICDNTLDLKKRPIQIIGNSCIIDRVSTGWSGLREVASEVKDRVIEDYREKNGDIFDRRSIASIDDFFSTSEVILDWHDF